MRAVNSDTQAGGGMQVVKQERSIEDKKQPTSGSGQPQTPSTHTIPLNKLGSTKQRSIRSAAL